MSHALFVQEVNSQANMATVTLSQAVLRGLPHAQGFGEAVLLRTVWTWPLLLCGKDYVCRFAMRPEPI